ncbi:hypothetical protein [Roseateles sp. L2-2]|uniref:hypothetical protein n=1 Tax=Roseateles TaxID=93681 RepID=UPI003D35DBBA
MGAGAIDRQQELLEEQELLEDLHRAVRAQCSDHLHHLQEAAARLHRAGGRLFLTGGAIRDAFFGRQPSDIDLVADLPLEKLARIFPQHTRWGRRFDSLRIELQGQFFELSSLRQSGCSAAGPFAYLGGGVEYAGRSVHADALLRDLTIHSIYMDLFSGQIHDPCHGLRDLSAHRIKFVGTPEASLTHDPIRALRALRIAARHRLSIEAELIAPLQNALDVTGPDPRAHYELYRALIDPSVAVFLGLLEAIDRLSGFLIPSQIDPARAKHALYLGTEMLNPVSGKIRNLEAALAVLLLPTAVSTWARDQSANDAERTCRTLAAAVLPGLLTTSQQASLEARWMHWFRSRAAMPANA